MSCYYTGRAKPHIVYGAVDANSKPIADPVDGVAHVFDDARRAVEYRATIEAILGAPFRIAAWKVSPALAAAIEKLP